MRKNICKFKNTYVSLQHQTIRTSNNNLNKLQWQQNYNNDLTASNAKHAKN